ncbi:hypothetical protein P2G88_06690 [Aliiglaciecola sp. CAU 1673]|uniref:hypothetical protein n=1 Tax=Aliiglaciecola sp. CAU 1673 TaxID=3032595 RepID=UPI0023DB2E0F|nr:hypothetical protein [Aliiglaciecola sp. CAU 1673]MDF2177934.1 hypothetical protein [Aliiglaciecola sp. CAU 1673]
MDTYLKERIRNVYPTGFISEPDTEQFDANNMLRRLTHVLQLSNIQLPLYYRGSSHRRGPPIYDLAFTHRNTRDMDMWVALSNAEKIALIREWRHPFTVLSISVSRVADFYLCHFNHWHPRGDTGYLDAISTEEPSSEWQGYKEGLCRLLQVQGFKDATALPLEQIVPGTKAWGGDEVPDDDPRWEDIEFDPEPVPATLYQCLYGEW